MRIACLVKVMREENGAVNEQTHILSQPFLFRVLPVYLQALCESCFSPKAAYFSSSGI